MSAADPHNLQRFVEAQAGVIETAMAELRAGRKRTHWMWFVFPQLAGLGSSPTAQRYAIRSAEEARAYLAHPLLGPRLLEAVAAVAPWADRPPRDIFGPPDDLKFHSSLTLFALTAPDRQAFRTALDRHFDGREDARTEALLAA